MICRRCGREQPALASPCSECESGLLGSTSPIPQPKVQIPQSMDRTDGGLRGGEVEPSKLSDRRLNHGADRDGEADAGVTHREGSGSLGASAKVGGEIRDPVLRAAFVRAYQAWEKAQT